MVAAEDVGDGESETPTMIFIKIKATLAFLHSTTSSVGALVPGGGSIYTLQELVAKWCTTTYAAIRLVKATSSTSNGLKGGASKVVKKIVPNTCHVCRCVLGEMLRDCQGLVKVSVYPWIWCNERALDLNHLNKIGRHENCNCKFEQQLQLATYTQTLKYSNLRRWVNRESALHNFHTRPARHHHI